MQNKFKIGDRVRIKVFYDKKTVESWSEPYPEIWRTRRTGLISEVRADGNNYVAEWGTSVMYDREIELVPKTIVVINNKK